MFSTIADTLRVEEAFTLDILMAKMPNAELLKECFDISTWLEDYLSPISNHSKTGMFRFRLSKEQSGYVDIFYRKNSDQKWKVLRGGIFRTSGRKPMLPKGKPAPLLPSLERIDIVTLKRNLQKWKNYFENDPSPENWWNAFLTRIEGSVMSSTRNYIWNLDRIPPYNPSALTDKECALDPIPEHIQELLAEEEGNPVVITFLHYIILH